MEFEANSALTKIAVWPTERKIAPSNICACVSLLLCRLIVQFIWILVQSYAHLNGAALSRIIAVIVSRENIAGLICRAVFHLNIIHFVFRVSFATLDLAIQLCRFSNGRSSRGFGSDSAERKSSWGEPAWGARAVFAAMQYPIFSRIPQPS